MFNAKDINKQLKQTIEDFKNTYKATCKKSHDDYLKQVGGGAKVYIRKIRRSAPKKPAKPSRMNV